MISSGNRYKKMIRNGLVAANLLLLLGLVSVPAVALEFETRVALPNGVTPFGINEVVIRWSTDVLQPGDPLVGTITLSDLTALSVKLDDSTAGLGVVFIDDILVGGSDILQPTGLDPERVPGDVLFEFDLDTLQLIRFRNVLTVAGITGTFYKVDIKDNPDTYTLVPYQANVKKNWEAARLAAEQAGGHLAIIDSLEEDLLIHDLVRNAVGNHSAWVGGIQEEGEGVDNYVWVNVDGGVDGEPIPADNSGQLGYANWLSGEANDLRGTDFLAINQGGNFGWNGRNKVGNIAAFVVEFPDAFPVIVTRFIFIPMEEVEVVEAIELELIQRTAQVSGSTVRNMPTPLGSGTIFDIDSFEQEAQDVITSGATNADFCVAPDPREPFIINGKGRPSKGKGKDNGNVGDGGADVFNQRDVTLAELAGTGTCTGELGVPDTEFATWEDLLAEIDLIIPARFRGFKGELTLDSGLVGEGVLFTIGVVRSEAEYDGVVSVVGFPETLIDYSNQIPELTPGCDRDLPYRNFSLGGTVFNFDEVPNVEGNNMIVETVQCNRAWSLTRRTTHVFPVRLEAPGGSLSMELNNIEVMFDGIQDTLLEAALCTNSYLSLALQSSLDSARAAFGADNYGLAISSLEQVALDADADDGFDSGGVVGFNTCPFGTNYRGNFVSRGLSAAFTVHDRFLHAENFGVLYVLPSPRFDELKPDLR